MRRYDDRGGMRGLGGSLGFGGLGMGMNVGDGGLGGLESSVEEISKVAAPKPIDRDKTCPLLLRLFYQLGRHHSPMEYAHGKTPLNELQIYTWLDASLRELTSLITEVNPDTRRRGTYFEFKIVCLAANGTYRLRDIGTTCAGIKGVDDMKTLAQSGFIIGDYLDVCITPPQRVIGSGPRRPRPY